MSLRGVREVLWLILVRYWRVEECLVTGRTRALGWNEGVLAMEGEIMMEKKREHKRKE